MFYGLTSCIARLLAGRVCDLKCINPHVVFQFGSFIGASSIILLPLARSYIHFLVCSLFVGLGNGTSITTSNLIFLTCVDKRRRASAFGLASCLGSLAVLVSSPLAGKSVQVCCPSEPPRVPVSRCQGSQRGTPKGFRSAANVFMDTRSRAKLSETLDSRRYSKTLRAPGPSPLPNSPFWDPKMCHCVFYQQKIRLTNGIWK